MEGLARDDAVRVVSVATGFNSCVATVLPPTFDLMMRKRCTRPRVQMSKA